MNGNLIVKTIRKNWRKMVKIGRRGSNSDIIFFTDDILARYTKNHRELQAVIAIVSNYREGVDVKSSDFRPRGICKAEGGVNVGGKEIVIKRSKGVIKCYSDRDEKDTVVPKTVKEVVEEILSIENPDPLRIFSVLIEYAVKNTNVPEDILIEKVYRFVDEPYGGDSLWRLLSN